MFLPRGSPQPAAAGNGNLPDATDRSATTTDGSVPLSATVAAAASTFSDSGDCDTDDNGSGNDDDDDGDDQQGGAAWSFADDLLARAVLCPAGLAALAAKSRRRTARRDKDAGGADRGGGCGLERWRRDGLALARGGGARSPWRKARPRRNGL